jgi:archaellum biogenesis protein FlaJ (TadC family)
VFTGVITISTVIYTVVTYRLWRTTQASVDVAKYTAFNTYLYALANEIEKAKGIDPNAAVFLERFSVLIADVAAEAMLKDIDLKKNDAARQYFTKLEELVSSYGIDPAIVPFLKVIRGRLDN